MSRVVDVAIMGGQSSHVIFLSCWPPLTTMISTSIQGGAAGVFLAGHIKSLRPNSRVILLEATRTLLKKVKIRIPHPKKPKRRIAENKKRWRYPVVDVATWPIEHYRHVTCLKIIQEVSTMWGSYIASCWIISFNPPLNLIHGGGRELLASFTSFGTVESQEWFEANVIP